MFKNRIKYIVIKNNEYVIEDVVIFCWSINSNNDPDYYYWQINE